MLRNTAHDAVDTWSKCFRNNTHLKPLNNVSLLKNEGNEGESLKLIPSCKRVRYQSRLLVAEFKATFTDHNDGTKIDKGITIFVFQ